MSGYLLGIFQFAESTLGIANRKRVHRRIPILSDDRRDYTRIQAAAKKNAQRYVANETRGYGPFEVRPASARQIFRFNMPIECRRRYDIPILLDFQLKAAAGGREHQTMPRHQFANAGEHRPVVGDIAERQILRQKSFV